MKILDILLGKKTDTRPWYWKSDTPEARTRRYAEMEHVPYEDYKIGIRLEDDKELREWKRKVYRAKHREERGGKHMTNIIKLTSEPSKRLQDIINCKCHCHNLCPGAYGGWEVGDAKAACLCFPMECSHCEGLPYPAVGPRGENKFGGGELKVYTEKDLQDRLDMQKKKLLQKLLDKGHGGGNWRRLIIMLKEGEHHE